MSKHQLDPRYVVIQRVTVPHYVYEEMKKDFIVGYPEDVTDFIKDLETELFGVNWNCDCDHRNHIAKMRTIVSMLLDERKFLLKENKNGR